MEKQRLQNSDPVAQTWKLAELRFQLWFESRKAERWLGVSQPTRGNVVTDSNLTQRPLTKFKIYFLRHQITKPFTLLSLQPFLTALNYVDENVFALVEGRIKGKTEVDEPEVIG